MNNLKRCEQLKEEEYQGIFGVTKATFDKMLLILEEAYKRLHSKGGSPLKRLSVLGRVNTRVRSRQQKQKAGSPRK